MATQTNVNITRQDPEIEAFRLGLLDDTQSLVRDQIFGQNVQNLRDQGLSENQILERLNLTTDAEGNPLSEEEMAANLERVGNISQDQLFSPPDYETAGISEGEQQAVDLAQEGIGGYQPFLDDAESTLGQASDLMTGAAAGLGTAGDAAMAEARTGQANLGQAIQGGRDVAATTAGQISDAVGAQRGIAGDASQALASQALAGQAGIGQAVQQGQREADIGQAALSGTSNFARQVAGQTQQGMLGQARRGQVGADVAAQRARASTADAQRQLRDAGNFGMGAARSGIGQLQGTTGGFDPQGIGSFMNQYEDAAVQQAMQDIAAAGAQQRKAIGDAETFAGGSRRIRGEVERGMLSENILKEQGRTAASMRQAGFESAAQRAQKAFEDQMGRGQSAAMGTGELGQAGASTQVDAAGRAGQLGLGAEGLAQTGSLQGAQLGMEAYGTGGQMGLDAAGLRQRGDIAGTQFGMSAADAARAGATTGAELGMGAAETGARLGMGAEQAGITGSQIAGQMGMSAEEAAARGAIAGTGLGMDAVRTDMAAEQGIGSLGGQLAGVGMNQATLGGQTSALGAADIDRLITTGGLERGIEQAGIEADRMTDLQAYSQPYQQYGFMSDIYSGVPTGSSTTQVASMPRTNPVQTAVGLGIGAYGAATGAQQAGLF